MTLGAHDAETFARCIQVGGVAVFPADTVYGLACEPDTPEAVERLYGLKGRRPDKPAAEACGARRRISDSPSAPA